MNLLEVKNISKSFDDLQVLKEMKKKLFLYLAHLVLVSQLF